MSKPLLALACLTATAAALRQTPALAIRAQTQYCVRTRKFFAQFQQPQPQGGYFPQQQQQQQQGGFGQDPYAQQQGGQSGNGLDSYQQQQIYTQQDWYAQQADMQDLPAGWRTGVDPSSGATYYYSEQTGQYQWEPPQHGSYPQQSYGDAQIVWRVASANGWGPMGSSGRYTLRSNGRSQLVVLGRYDMELDRPYRPFVSRRQCEIRLQADGTATLTSTGKPPTFWRPLGGQWVALQSGESLALSNGDQVSVDANDPEGTVFNCNGFWEQQDDYQVARALDDVAMAEERLRQSAQYSGPSMDALEALETADQRLAAEEHARYDQHY